LASFAIERRYSAPNGIGTQFATLIESEDVPMMNSATQVLTRFFIFGQEYRPGDDYVRCEGQRRSVVVAPGVGEVPAGDELAFDRCLRLASKGVMREADPDEILQRC
jgi:hypothetical protein